jgi:hypothetical protein
VRVALRQAVNASLIFKSRRVRRCAPDRVPVPGLPWGSRFLPVVIAEAMAVPPVAATTRNRIQVELVD